MMDTAQQMYSAHLDLNDPAVRRYIVKRGGLLGWCMVYLRHYFTVEPADFHFLLANILSDPSEELLLIIGFRGCAKSTFAILGDPLYNALEHLADFIVIAGDTTTQTQMNIANVRYELETNPLILEDYGMMFNTDKNWSQDKLMLNNGVLVLGRSRGQKMRGLRHRQHRPQRVIVDDAEDLEWTKKKENRDKTERWLNSEVIPAQQEDKSKLVIIGNLLHQDALMMRLKRKKRGDGRSLFKLLEFPLFDKNGKCTWRGKYPDDAAVQKQREKIGSASAWSREYLLKIVAEEDQVIKETDIHRYDTKILDQRDDNGMLKFPILDGGVGNDLAISEKQSADCTAMVAGKIVMLDGKKRILVMPNPVNKRMGFDATLKEAATVNAKMPYGTKWYVEDTGYQRAAIEKMGKAGLTVYSMRPITDKKARFETISPFIIDGTILFPEFGCEELINQMLDFGSAEHDDLLDALVYLVMGMTKRKTYKEMERPDKI